MAKNYSKLYDHKQTIPIPYTHYKVNGKLYFLLMIVISAAVSGIFFFITSLYVVNEITISASIAAGILAFIGVLIASQSYNAESGNLAVMDKIYKHTFKVPIVYDKDNRANLLLKGKKDLDSLIDYSKLR